MNRPILSYDGCGINGPDEYRSRLATFTSSERADRYGRLFACSSELLAALTQIVGHRGLRGLVLSEWGEEEYRRLFEPLDALVISASGLHPVPALDPTTPPFEVPVNGMQEGGAE